MSYDFTLTPSPEPGMPPAPFPLEPVRAILRRTPGMARTGDAEWTWLVAAAPLAEQDIRERVLCLERENRLPDDMHPVDLVEEPPGRLAVRVPFASPVEIFSTVLDLVFELGRDARLDVRDEKLGRIVTVRDRGAAVRSWEAAHGAARQGFGIRLGRRASPGAAVPSPPSTVGAAAAPPLENRGPLPLGFLLLLAAVFAAVLLLRWLVRGGL